MTAPPEPGTARAAGQAPAQITDAQVIEWAAQAAAPGPITVASLHVVHWLVGQAKQALARRCPTGSRHLLGSVELWPNLGTDGTLAGVLLTVDLPPGTATPEPGTVRLCTLPLDLEDLVDPGHMHPSPRELYTALLTTVLSRARDEIGKYRRALLYDNLAGALADARAALAGDSGDAEHDALYRLACLVASILESGQLATETITRDGDWLHCLCGNTPDMDGFHPCLPDGTEVEPLAGGPCDGRLYWCARCDRIIDQHTLEVTGRRPPYPDGSQAGG